MLERLLEAASLAVDLVLVEPGRGALWRADDQSVVGRKLVKGIGICLHRVRVSELDTGTDPVLGEAGNACTDAVCCVSTGGVFVDIPLRCGRAVRGRDYESLYRVVAGESPNARAELGRGAGRVDDNE